MEFHPLRSIRLDRGLAIAAVAVRARVASGTIITIEKYGHNPRPETKQRLAAALGVEVEAIWPASEEHQHNSGV